MKKLTADSVSPTTKAWFGAQIQTLALRHDLAGPDIRRVRLLRYAKKAIKQLNLLASAAMKEQILSIQQEHLNALCRRAARDLIAIRRIRAAHESGALTTTAMRQLPAYLAFRDYFDENPSLVFDEMVVAVRAVRNFQPEPTGSVPLSKLGTAAPPSSPGAWEWLQLQIVGLATADDIWGPSTVSLNERDYITDGAERLRSNVLRALTIGDLELRAEEVAPLCCWAAAEALAIRRLKADLAGGQLSHERLQQNPRYSSYKEYFEQGPEWTEMAKMFSEISESSPVPPDNRN